MRHLRRRRIPPRGRRFAIGACRGRASSGAAAGRSVSAGAERARACLHAQGAVRCSMEAAARRPHQVRGVRLAHHPGEAVAGCAGRGYGFRGRAQPRPRPGRTHVSACSTALRRPLSKHSADRCFGGIAAVSPAESRRPLCESCLQRNGVAASDLARRVGRATQNDAS